MESSDRIEDGILFSVMRQTNFLQRAVMDGSLTDKENVLNWVMSRPDVLPRLNPRLIGSEHEEANEQRTLQPSIFISNDDISCDDNENIFDKIRYFLFKFFFSNLKLFSKQKRFICLLKERRYLIRSDEIDDETIHWVTVWLITDINSFKGQQLLRNALKSLKKSNYMRISLIHNGANISNEKKNLWTIAHIFDAIFTRLSSSSAKRALNKLLGLEYIKEKLFNEKEVENLLNEVVGHGIGIDPILSELKSGQVERRLALQSVFASNDLNLIPGQIAVFINSKVYGPIDNDEDFGLEDFILAERLAERKGIKKVSELIKNWQKQGTKVLLFKLIN